jgi:hypothetical protein
MHAPYTAIDLVRVMQEGIEQRDAQLQSRARKGFDQAAPEADERQSRLRWLLSRVRFHQRELVVRRSIVVPASR